MRILVPWKPVVVVWGLLSAMIFFGFLASSVLQGKDPFAPGAIITQPPATKAGAAQAGQQPKQSHKLLGLRVSEDLGDLLLLICLFRLFDHVLAWFTLPNIFASFCFSMTSAGECPWRPSHETKSFILTSCFTGGCWTTTVTVVNPWPISPTQLSCCKAARAVAMAS